MESTSVPKVAAERKVPACRRLQAASLVVIPLICLAIIVFVSVFAVKCNRTGGFMFTPRDGVVCVSSPRRAFDTHGREVVAPARPEAEEAVPEDGTFMMNLTRMVLVIVAVLIVGFTVWICVWYRMYGTKSSSNPSQEDAEAGEGPCPERSPIYLYTQEGLPTKPDLQRLLGAEVVTPSSA